VREKASQFLRRDGHGGFDGHRGCREGLTRRKREEKLKDTSLKYRSGGARGINRGLGVTRKEIKS